MTPFDPPVGRGGPQVIPRPEGASPGASAPWLDLPAELRALNADDLRASLADREPGVLFTGVPARRRDAAVLAPFYEDDDRGGLHVVLTRRSPRLRSHTHQVSFPGGSRDDGESLEETALREAEEEIALDPASVELIGELDRLHTYTSGAVIVPFVGVLPGRPDLVPSPAEVEHILHVPVAELLDDGVHREELWPFPDGGVRPVHFFELVGDTVWGATAAMLRQLLLTCLGLPEPSPRPLTP